MKYIFNLFIIVSLLEGIFIFPAFSQTCCSGGVPLSGNIGFESSDGGTIQMELSYDLNYLATLKEGSDVYTDDIRRRTTHSVLFKAGYSINRWFAIDGLFSFVAQGRKISYQESVNEVNTLGIGDAVVIAKVILSGLQDSGTEIQLGAGPKMPLGSTDNTDERGITLNADLQPGSGSWDLVTWGYFVRAFGWRPSANFSGRIVGKFNGSNPDYLGSQTYHFGNSIQLFAGFGDRFSFGNRIISPSVSLRYRRAFPDRINGKKLDNTGGEWINFIPAIDWSPGQSTIIQFIPEIPVISRVEGIQLTPTFRFQVGIFHFFGKKSKEQTKDYRL